jgi:threonyl-tRNA synthetase
MKEMNETYKVALIGRVPDGEEISFYHQGDFTDLCAGPHLFSTGSVKAFKLIQSTGAYWEGNSKNKMLQRIYGVAYPTKEELDKYITIIEEAKRRDHNKIGRELGYFTTSDIIGQGLPLLMPKGAKLFQILNRYIQDKEEYEYGYVMTRTPYMAKSDLYKISGHWDHYKDGMFILGNEEKDKEIFALRPMTCPFQYQIYLAEKHSYRDLPIRYGETSTLFRNEDSGEMHGLIRVRQFTITEGHLIIRPDQLEDEFKNCIKLIKEVMTDIGLIDSLTYRLSKWDPNDRNKYIGTPEMWDEAEGLMRNILTNIGLEYAEAVGEAAFYGPKLDVQMKNVHGKEDTLVTVQIDLMLAHQFEMTYTDTDGTQKYPYIIHRTSLGCYERTIALLLEKYAGALPLWLSPTQIRILPITDSHVNYANEIAKKYRMSGLRVEVDIRNEKIGYKIRAAQLEKIPYMLIIGDKEMENGEVSVRSRRDSELGTMNVDVFMNKTLRENMIKEK